jgi:hypothetical protein
MRIIGGHVGRGTNGQTDGSTGKQIDWNNTRKKHTAKVLNNMGCES